MNTHEYIKLQEWQIKEIQAGLQEAEQGDLIEHELIIKKYSSFLVRLPAPSQNREF
ncbi:MAG: hypothetical protein ABSF18_02420 [Gammaproteobacteria bacterium]|jgi:predicted transcriptional regulator